MSWINWRNGWIWGQESVCGPHETAAASWLETKNLSSSSSASPARHNVPPDSHQVYWWSFRQLLLWQRSKLPVFWWKPKTNMKMYRDLLVTLESCWRGFVGCSVLCVAAGAQLWRTDYLLFLTSHSYVVKFDKYNWLQLDCSGEYYITQSFSGSYSFKRNFLRNTVEASVGSALHELKLFRKSMKKNKLSRFLSG